MPQVNWEKLKTELNKYSDLETLKAEVHKLSQELKSFDIHVHLSPKAKERLKAVEDKYHEISKTLNKTQRQFDKELDRLVRQFKSQRTKAESKLHLVKSAAITQKKKLEKVSLDLKSKVLGQPQRKKKSGVRKKPVRSAKPNTSTKI